MLRNHQPTLHTLGDQVFTNFRSGVHSSANPPRRRERPGFQARVWARPLI
jgi:hypothetical protein